MNDPATSLHLPTMEEEYLKGLYQEEELQPIPEAKVVILLPLTYQGVKEEITMLDRLLTAMGFPAAERRFAYHMGKPEKQLIWEEQATILFFSEDPATEPAQKGLENNGMKWMNLPPPGIINQEKEIKKRVWSLLKN